MAFIEPCFGIGHNLSLICQMTSEDIKHQLIRRERSERSISPSLNSVVPVHVQTHAASAAAAVSMVTAAAGPLRHRCHSGHRGTGLRKLYAAVDTHCKQAIGPVLSGNSVSCTLPWTLTGKQAIGPVLSGNSFCSSKG